MGKAQDLSHLRSDLSGITVNGLLAADDKVHILDLLHSRRKDTGGGKGIRAADGSVIDVNAEVSSQCICVQQNLLCVRRPHGQCNHFAAQLLPDLHALFNCKFIERIQNGGSLITNQSTGLRIDLDFHGVGYLFYTHNNFHCVQPSLSFHIASRFRFSIA